MKILEYILYLGVPAGMLVEMLFNALGIPFPNALGGAICLVFGVLILVLAAFGVWMLFF
jgi:hypothetical protein